MTDITAHNLTLGGFGNLAAPIGSRVNRHPIAIELSGLTLSQSGAVTGSVDLSEGDFVYQTFRLPTNYPRGYNSGQVRIPPICGLQVNVNVEVQFANVAALDYRLDYYIPPAEVVNAAPQPVRQPGRTPSKHQIPQNLNNVPGTGYHLVQRPGAPLSTLLDRKIPSGWVGLVKGTEVGSPGDGDVWFDMNFDPVDITDVWQRTFRLGVRSRPFDEEEPFFEPVEYDRALNTVIVNDDAVQVIPDISPAPLVEGKWYPFTYQEVDYVLYVEEGSGTVYLSRQQGVQAAYYTAPNPYILSNLKAYQSDGVNPVIDNGRETSLRFRVLSAAPQKGPDCAGNDIGSVVVPSEPENLGSTTGDLKDAFWLSKPNPSQFAVEALYFDIRDGDAASVIDHILIDPLTPGVYFHVYYSNDDQPGIDPDTWDGLLWTRVDKTYLLRQKESLAFPQPITAKYLKVEFTHLQPRSYSPGTLRLPVIYRKHPKWVVDYFLAIYQRRRAADLEAAKTVSVQFDALDLAYNYYLDDLHQSFPVQPAALRTATETTVLNNFLETEGAVDENRVDASTLLRIRQSFVPFLSQPFFQGRFGDILRQYAAPNTSTLTNYPTEVQTIPLVDLGEVSSLDRESLVVDKQFPVTSFYLTCRHYYKQSVSDFEQDRAYFVGLREIAFTREHFDSKFDHPLYIETAGDNVNIERNDFASLPTGPDEVAAWTTYDDNAPS
jgi:hypothetical protein